MEDILAAPNLHVLCSIQQANCHPLKGNREDEWAIDISANHRIIFLLNHDPIPLKDDGGVKTIEITDIKIISTQEDYH